jgi:hypothetical protein
MKISPDFANLSEEKIAKIKDLEQSMDIVLVAYENLPDLAELDEIQLEKLKKFEKELGFNLVAWK